MATLSGDERLVVFLLVGLALAVGLLLWWQGQNPDSELGWVGEGAGPAGTSSASGGPGLDPAGQALDLADESGEGEEQGPDGGEAVGEQACETIVVHVAGAVKQPGVYSLPAGSRMVDAVNACGGVTASADPNAVNLARSLNDGERLYIPTRDEVRRLGASWDPWPEPSPGAGAAASSGPGSGSAAPAGPVNLNTANQAQLETLPGIGPALATRIIQYRSQNGPFAAVEELLNVSGIGEKKLAELEGLVTVR